MKTRKLTPKQKRFVEVVATGDTATLVSAYTEAGYGTDGAKRSTLRTGASRLAKAPHVAPMIEERREQIEQQTHSGMIASRRYVLARLREEADDRDSPASARITALALLAKASGALEDAVDREAKRASASESELLAELEARLSHLYPDIGAIDVAGDVIDVQDAQPESAGSPASDEPGEG